MCPSRPFAPRAASGGVPRFLISRILNHSQERDIMRVYDRYSCDAEKRAAMEFWGRQLNCVLGERPLSNAGRFDNSGVVVGESR
jgi:hypothetical protein